MDKLHQNMLILLADTYALYLKTQNYHWNVTGRHFFTLHRMFEEQYKDLAEAIDDIAERMRMLNYKVNATFTELNKLKTIDDGNIDFSEKEMVGDLAASQTTILKTLNDVLKAAEEAKDQVTIGLIIDRMSYHEKVKWMLASSMQ